MSEIYLVRNLLSIKSATAIVNGYRQSKPIFSVVSGNHNLGEIIKNNLLRNNSYEICDSIALLLLPFRLSAIRKQRKIVKKMEDDVKKLLANKEVERIFITYPMHLDSYIYFKEAKKLGLEVCFFEEGPCFYRAGLTKQYKIVNFRSLIKKIYFRMVGLDFGYNFKPDKWYSSLPMSVPFIQISLIYNKVDVSENVKNVFLSRPVSEDFPELTLLDEANAIRLFVDKVELTNEDVYIKFHPRESEIKRKTLLTILTEMKMSVKYLDGEYSSEDLLFSMTKGIVCGYDTSTLVYSNNINPNVQSFSVLSVIMNKDSSGFLNECYDEYCKKYPHIKMIQE